MNISTTKTCARRHLNAYVSGRACIERGVPLKSDQTVESDPACTKEAEERQVCVSIRILCTAPSAHVFIVARHELFRT